MKRGGMLFLGLLFLVPFVDSARDYSFMPDELLKFFKGEDPSSRDNNNSANSCHSCLEISRKAKEILRDPTLFDEIASMFCRLGPSDSKTKCTQMVEMYKREAVVFLQEIAVEENFCNKTGFCLPDKADQEGGRASSSTSARAQPKGMLSKTQKGGSTKEAATRFLKSRSSLTRKEIPLELGSNRTCTACHNVLDKLRNELEDPDKQLKIISSLIKACETEVFVYRCKKMVFAYGPILITNLQKLVNMDLCRMVHLCVDPKNQTNPAVAGVHLGRHLPIAVAKLENIHRM